jgi:hypothetical protein
MTRADTITRAEAMLREAPGRMMTLKQIARLRLAFKLESGTHKDRIEAGQICQAIEAELRAGIDETVALARGRGGEVEEGIGPTRITDHDGLRSLLNVKDGLSSDQYDAGMAFREGWEARSADLGSQMGGEGTSGGAHNNDRFVLTRLARAKKLQRLGNMIRGVAVECSAEPASLQMLQAVAGDGKALRVFGAGRAFARNLSALKAALDVVGKMIGQQGGDLGGGVDPQHLAPKPPPHTRA